MNFSPQVTTFHSAVIPQQHTLSRRPPAAPRHSHDGLGVLQHAGLWSKRGHRARPVQRASPPAGRGDTPGEQTCMQAFHRSALTPITCAVPTDGPRRPCAGPQGCAAAPHAVLCSISNSRVFLREGTPDQGGCPAPPQKKGQAPTSGDRPGNLKLSSLSDKSVWGPVLWPIRGTQALRD